MTKSLEQIQHFWIAHHFSHVPLYGLIIVFLITTAYTIAVINWFTDLYRKKSLKHKVILQQLSVNQFLLYPEKTLKKITLGLHIVNNSDIPIFFTIELKSYHLAGITNIQMSSNAKLDIMSPRRISHMSLPSIDILDNNKNRSGNLKFVLSYGIKPEKMKYKIDVEIDIGLIFLENNQLLHEQNIKKFEYI